MQRQLAEAVRNDCARLTIMERTFTEDYPPFPPSSRSQLWAMPATQAVTLLDALYDAGVEFLDGLRQTAVGHRVRDLATCPVCKDERCPRHPAAEGLLAVIGVGLKQASSDGSDKPARGQEE